MPFVKFRLDYLLAEFIDDYDRAPVKDAFILSFSFQAFLSLGRAFDTTG